MKKRTHVPSGYYGETDWSRRNQVGGEGLTTGIITRESRGRLKQLIKEHPKQFALAVAAILGFIAGVVAIPDRYDSSLVPGLPSETPTYEPTTDCQATATVTPTVEPTDEVDPDKFWYDVARDFNRADTVPGAKFLGDKTK